MLTKEWIRMILNGEKKLMSLSQIRPIHVGHFPEVSIKNLYSDFSSRDEVMIYLPAQLPKGR